MRSLLKSKGSISFQAVVSISYFNKRKLEEHITIACVRYLVCFFYTKTKPLKLVFGARAKKAVLIRSAVLNGTPNEQFPKYICTKEAIRAFG